MRATTFSLAAVFALVASVAAAPVASPSDLSIPADAASPSVVEVEVSEESVLEANEDSSVLYHVLDKRATKCSKAAQCSKGVPSGAVGYCSSKKVCSWACKTGYTKKGSTCVAPAKKTTTAAKKTASTSSSVQLAATSYSGQATWFTQNGVAGACGKVNADNTYLVALQTKMYANGAHCGKKINLKVGSKTIQALVADECPSCRDSQSLDLSLGAFKALGNLDQGVLNAVWSFA
ncbi:hypothetical protein JCM8097_005208 [Rhodosporidiobolus ruineniae]